MIEWLKQQLKTHDGFRLRIHSMDDRSSLSCTLLAVDHVGLVVQWGSREGRIEMVPWTAAARVEFVE